MSSGGVCSIRRRATAGLVLFVAIVAVGVVQASAAHAATTLEIVPGYGGTYLPGRPLPVRVKVSADRLLAAELHVAVDGPPTAVDIEVPGGTTKEFLVVLPTEPDPFNDLTVTASLPGVSGSTAATASVTPNGDQQAVGLLPGALAGRPVPGPAALSVDVGTARFVALGPLELDRAPESLYALTTIGAGPDELARQAPSVRTGLLQWVEAGGRLLIDAAPGAAVAGLPDEWQPGPSGRARAGAGEIRLTSGAMAGGGWAGLIEPAAGPGGDNFVAGPPLGDMLASEAGFRLARISWLVWFLVAYVVVVGPALYLVLRQAHRPELAWVVIPLVSLLFTGGSWAAGRGLRHATPVVHGSVVVTGAQGSTALSYLGVSSRAGGTTRLGFPENWLLGTRDNVANDRSTSLVQVTGSGIEGRVPLDSGQFALVAARGPVPMDGTIEVAATSNASGDITGTVKNTTQLALDGVAVLVGNATTTLGPLGPGEEQPWTATDNAIAFRRGLDPSTWGIDQSDGDLSRAGWTRYALWSSAVRTGLVPATSGHAVAAGWTRDFKPPVTVNGTGAQATGQTLVVGTAPVRAAAGSFGAAAVQADVVRSPSSRDPFSVVRLGLPPERAGTGASVSLSLPTLPAEVWALGRWSSAGPDGVGGSNAAPTTVPVKCLPNGPCAVAAAPAGGVVFSDGSLADVALPAAAVTNGAVYVRFIGGLPSGPWGNVLPSLREVS